MLSKIGNLWQGIIDFKAMTVGHTIPFRALKCVGIINVCGQHGYTTNQTV